MEDPVHAITRHLQAAVDAFGADLTVPVPRAAPTERSAGGAAERPSASPTRARPTPHTPSAAAEPVSARRGPGHEPAPPTAGADTAAPAGCRETESLEALSAEVQSCTRCKLHEGRKNTVFGEGSPSARVLFIGEAPGAVEDRTGRPFVGPAGQLLDRIINNAMGLSRSDVYIGNVNKCRPPGNRDPRPDEVAACLPYLRRQVAALRPDVIVTLGRVAAHNLLGTTAPMRALRGRELEYEGVPVVATWHPAYLLRQPSAKRDTWDDIKRVNRLLGLPEVPTSRPGGPPAAGRNE